LSPAQERGQKTDEFEAIHERFEVQFPLEANLLENEILRASRKFMLKSSEWSVILT